MIYNQTWLEKLRRRFGRFGIPNLMLIIVGAMAIVFVMDFAVMAASGRSLSSVLAFDRAMIFRGQVWRIFTFLFIPPSSSLLFAALTLYFYWLIGSTLENQWGSFGFTLYYLLGVVGAIVCGFISGTPLIIISNVAVFRVCYALSGLSGAFVLLYSGEDEVAGGGGRGVVCVEFYHDGLCRSAGAYRGGDQCVCVLRAAVCGLGEVALPSMEVEAEFQKIDVLPGELVKQTKSARAFRSISTRPNIYFQKISLQ
ncbi:MAG: hypothetical protein ACLR5G_13260 [Eubacteriales bacterium]